MPPVTDAQRRVAELTTLNALAQTLNRAADLRDVLESAIEHIVELMSLQTGWIFLYAEHEPFRLAARHGLPPAINYPGPAWQDTCTCQEQCLSGKMTKAVNMVRCSRLRHAVGDKRGLAQHASVPLHNGDELLGILNVATGEFGRFSAAQLELLSAIGHLLGTAITRTRLYEQVKVRRVQEQAALLQLSQDLLGAPALESGLQRLARVGARLLEADACAFAEADEPNGTAMLLAAHGWRFLPPSGLPLALDQENPHLWYLPDQTADLQADAMGDLPPLLKAQNFRGHLGVAVMIGDVPIGTLMVNTRAPRTFLEEDAQLLGLLGSQLAQTLERERLHQDALARERLERELDLARGIQTSFLPDCCPTVAGYRIASFYQAARQVGGDFYDFIELPPEGVPITRGQRLSGEMQHGRLGCVIADVTDKGVPAALFMVLSRTLLRATASDGRAPASVLAQSNRLILDDARSGMFVTVFYCILDTTTGALHYANGGHNYPLLYRAATDTIEQLQTIGLVLGVMPEPRFEQRSTTLEPGDVLVLYTDGVTEAMDPRRQLFGEQRLNEVLRRSHSLPPEQIITRITEAVAHFTVGTPQSDDMTLVVITRERA